MMGYRTRSQGLPAFNPNVAACFRQVRITKELAFLHDLEAYHELESIQTSFAEALGYPKLFCYHRGAK